MGNAKTHHPMQILILGLYRRIGMTHNALPQELDAMQDVV